MDEPNELGSGGQTTDTSSGGGVNAGSGGLMGTGASIGSGGTVGSGGALAATGGALGIGGSAVASGGTTGGAEADATGGATSSGGNGGAVGTGGAGTGGSTATGGTTNTGGSSGTGGEPVGACGRVAASCSAPVVEISEIDMGDTITGYGNEGDTAPLPLAIAAMPSGGSRVAALGSNGQVRIAELDCEDKLVGTAFTIPAIDLQDIHADDDGGVVLVTRNATNGGTDNCGNGQLCGGSSSPCRSMWLVRFTRTGEIEWETQVTNLGNNLAGYQNGARFVWWYQHHGRLAFDGENYAAYFGVAITVNNNSCVDIHQGDRMQVVSSNGTLVANHPDSMQVGCSHAWQSRVVWDSRTNKFAKVCATDRAPCGIAIPNPFTMMAQGNCDGTLFGGDLVLSSTPGYWAAWSHSGQIRLDHFTTGASDKSITGAGASQHPHLVNYGANKMLLSWQSGSALKAQIRNSGDGTTIGSEFSINVPDHNYQAFKEYSDGSVAYPASGTSNTKVRIARVMACQ